MKLIVFDLGRVLVRLVDGWGHACACAGIEGDSSGWTPEARAAVTSLSDEYESGRLTCDAFRSRVCEHLPMHTPGQIEAVMGEWIRGTFEGVEQLIDDLHGAGLPTACLSNTNAHHWAMMMNDAAYAPLRKLRHHFASHLLLTRKPEAAIYAHVEQATGFSGGDVVFFDDLAENIAAARRLGWRGHLIQRAGEPVEQMRRALAAEGVL